MKFYFSITQVNIEDHSGRKPNKDTSTVILYGHKEQPVSGTTWLSVRDCTKVHVKQAARRQCDDLTLFLVCRNLPHSSPSMPGRHKAESRCLSDSCDRCGPEITVTIFTITTSPGILSCCQTEWGEKIKTPQKNELQLKLKEKRKPVSSSYDAWRNLKCNKNTHGA